MGTALAHRRSKTTTRRRLRALFGAVSTQQKGFFLQAGHKVDFIAPCGANKSTL